MSKFIYPEDGIKAVTFGKKNELSWVIADRSPVLIDITINVDAQAIERLKISCDLLMQAIGSKLLRWSDSLGIK